MFERLMNTRILVLLLVSVLVSLILVPSAASGGNPAPVAQETVTPPPADVSAGEIAFASDRDGSYQIYLMNADGSDQHNLTNTTTNATGPAWSPDGSQIAYMSDCQLRAGDPERPFEKSE
jgi:dipeptidyl aminopeptidase/acylaminoacyl peptidase